MRSSEVFGFLMTRTEVPLETLVYLTCNYLTQLQAEEYFIEFKAFSFKLCTTDLFVSYST
jgi:hypothetical protein